MTALSSIDRPQARPVPWTRLSWAVWRRHRPALFASLAVLAATAVYLIVEGVQLRSAYADYLDCSPAGSAECQQLWEAFRANHGESGLLGPLLLFLPPFVGILAGASVLGRELETGTFRYAWTQGVGRMRWAVAMLVSGAVGVAVIMGTFGALVLWHNQPLSDSGISSGLRPLVFPISGIAAAGWAILGFALAALAGLVCARVLPAIVGSLAVWFGLAYLAANVLRPNYQQPLTGTIDDVAGADTLIDVSWLKDGVRMSDRDVDTILQSIGVTLPGGATEQAGGAVDVAGYLARHGYEQVATYRPASQFWTMQLIEAAWLSVAAVALLGLTLWLLKRRPR